MPSSPAYSMPSNGTTNFHSLSEMMVFMVPPGLYDKTVTGKMETSSETTRTWHYNAK